MRAIVNTGPNQLELAKLPLPDPQAGQVRIQTAACGICATDFKMIAGWERTGFPAIPGHEWSGIVESVGGGVDAGWIGRRCVAQNVLTDGGEVGFEHPGGYSEYFVTDAANLRFLPDNFSLTEATLIEPLAICVRGIRRLRLEDRRTALIFGDGPIGLLMLCLLRLQKVEYILLAGGRPARLKLAREIGADMTLNYHELGVDLVAKIHGRFRLGFANVIEASGSDTAMRACRPVAQDKGKILVIGDYGSAQADFLLNDLLLHELELIGSNASAGAWDDALRLATEGAIPLAKLISRTVPAEEFKQGMELARNSPEMIKVVLKWMHDNAVS